MQSKIVLNTAVLDTLRALADIDDPNFFTDLMQQFIHDTQLRTNDLEHAIKTGDLVLQERTLHTLKSSCAQIGAMALSHLCATYEDQIRRQQPFDNKELLTTFHSHWQQLYQALQQLPELQTSPCPNSNA